MANIGDYKREREAIAEHGSGTSQNICGTNSENHVRDYKRGDSAEWEQRQEAPEREPDRGSRTWRLKARLRCQELNPEPWRHFWLPYRRPKEKAKDGDGTGKYEEMFPHKGDTDYEDDAPKRFRLGWRLTSRNGPNGRTEDEAHYGTYPGSDMDNPLPAPATEDDDPLFLSLHQLAEQTNPDMAPHTCSHCAKLVLDLRRSKEEYSIDRTERRRLWSSGRLTGLDVAAATVGAAEGCVLYCQLNLSKLPQDLLIATQFRISSSPLKRSTVRFLTTREPSNLHQRYMDTIYTIYTVPGERALFPALGDVLPPNLIPNSDLSFKRARRWLSDCEQTHSKCRAFNVLKKPHMPSRVLEVVGTPRELSVRLVANPKRAPYIALSYCWGGDQPAKLTKHRLTAYSHGVPLEQLPQTIKDAVIVTHRIGHRYLWVDALCIIQDDEKDKVQEIAVMHNIYRGALVTIAAAAAESSADGFLHPRREFRATKLTTSFEDNVFGDVVLVPTTALLHAAAAKDEGYRLYTRGWTFQENSLSSRILAYGHLELVFQCLESQQWDGGHGPHFGIRSPSEWGEEPLLLLRKLDPGNQRMAANGGAHPSSWMAIVESYSSGHLSNPHDKLPAVAALAEEYRDTQPVTRYLAGLWEEDLLLQSLWRVADSYMGGSRPPGYRAPSWSWASLDGEIVGPGSILGNRDYTYTCKLLKAETVLRNESSILAEVTGGYLHLHAKLRHVLWPTNNEASFYGRVAKNDPPPSNKPKNKRPYKGRLDSRLVFFLDIPSEWRDGEQVPFTCIEICTYVVDGFRHGLGLALVKVSSDVVDRPTIYGSTSVVNGKTYVNRLPLFRRVGFVKFGSSRSAGYWFDAGKYETREIAII